MSWITANYVTPGENNKEANTGFLLRRTWLYLSWFYGSIFTMCGYLVSNWGHLVLLVFLTFYSILIDNHVRDYIKCLTLEDFLAQWF